MPEYNTRSVAVVFVIAGAALFGRSLGYPFHFDDGLILADSNITNPERWFHFLNPLHLRQFTYFTFYLNHLLGGDNPAGFHAVNVAIHIANAIVLFHLLRNFIEPRMAAAAAAIFLVHPVQTEAVLYIYQRSTLLACLFSLSGLYAFHKRRIGWTALLFFLAFESKESAPAVPLALALLHPHVGRKWIAAASVSGGILAMGILFYRDEATVGLGAVETVTPLSYLGLQMRVVYTYLRLLVWPYPLSLEYAFPTFQFSWMTVLETAGLASLVAAGVWAMRQERWKIAGSAIVSFFLLLAPTSSIIPSADAAFEHRLYLPMAAFSVLLAWSLSFVPERVTLTAVLLIVLATLSARRTVVWSSNVTLWQDAVSRAPEKPRAWFNLGSAQLESDPQAARASFQRALALQPVFPDAYVALGNMEQNSGNVEQAILYYQEAIRQAEDHWPAWYNLGNAWLSRGDRDRALAGFERSLKLNGEYWPARYKIGIAHLSAGRAAEAIPHLRSALDWDPEFVEARRYLIEALTKSGDLEAAEEERKKLP